MRGKWRCWAAQTTWAWWVVEERDWPINENPTEAQQMDGGGGPTHRSSRLMTLGPFFCGGALGARTGSSSTTYWCRSPMPSRCRNLIVNERDTRRTKRSGRAGGGVRMTHLVTPIDTSRARWLAAAVLVRMTTKSMFGSCTGSEDTRHSIRGLTHTSSRPTARAMCSPTSPFVPTRISFGSLSLDCSAPHSSVWEWTRYAHLQSLPL